MREEGRDRPAFQRRRKRPMTPRPRGRVREKDGRAFRARLSLGSGLGPLPHGSNPPLVVPRARIQVGLDARGLSLAKGGWGEGTNKKREGRQGEVRRRPEAGEDVAGGPPASSGESSSPGGIATQGRPYPRCLSLRLRLHPRRGPGRCSHPSTSRPRRSRRAPDQRPRITTAFRGRRESGLVGKGERTERRPPSLGIEGRRKRRAGGKGRVPGKRHQRALSSAMVDSTAARSVAGSASRA